MPDVVYEESFEMRFWSRATPSDTGCWLWTAGKDRKGYGAISYHRKMLKAHRVAWELSFGAIPEGMMVCHSCDVPACVRPTHLFVGTAQMNSADMVAKGRVNRQPRTAGEKNGAAKINADGARLVRSIVASGAGHRAAAQAVGISLPQVANIVHRRHWRDA